MEEEWIKIYSSEKEYQAEMVKSILAEEQIESVVLSKQSSSYLIGEFEVYVNRDYVLKAKTLIEDSDL